jgi:hypothetical protein
MNNRPEPTQAELSELREQFTYHAPHGDQAERYQELREAGRHLANTILRTVPKCADRTAAIRKVREAIMTANAAIAITEVVPETVNS